MEEEEEKEEEDLADNHEQEKLKALSVLGDGGKVVLRPKSAIHNIYPIITNGQISCLDLNARTEISVCARDKSHKYELERGA